MGLRTLVDPHRGPARRSPDITKTVRQNSRPTHRKDKTNAALSKGDTHHFLGIGRGDQEKTVSSAGDGIDLAAHN